jgi:hypothetical protein
MARFASDALLKAGLLKSVCEEPLAATCPVCGGPRDGTVASCQTCYNSEPPHSRCMTCRQVVGGVVGDGRRSCMSQQAYDADPGMASPFARPDEPLWGLKPSRTATLEVVSEAVLRERLARGALDDKALLSNDGGTSFLAVGEWPQWRDAMRSGAPFATPRPGAGSEGAGAAREPSLGDAWLYANYARFLAAISSAVGGAKGWPTLSSLLPEAGNAVATANHAFVATGYVLTIAAFWWLGLLAPTRGRAGGAIYRRWTHAAWPFTLLAWPANGALHLWAALLASQRSATEYHVALIFGALGAITSCIVVAILVIKLGLANASSLGGLPRMVDRAGGKTVFLLLLLTAFLNLTFLVNGPWLPASLSPGKGGAHYPGVADGLDRSPPDPRLRDAGPLPAPPAPAPRTPPQSSSSQGATPQQKPQPLPPPASTRDAATWHWQHYVNDRFGLSVVFPANLFGNAVNFPGSSGVRFPENRDGATLSIWGAFAETGQAPYNYICGAVACLGQTYRASSSQRAVSSGIQGINIYYASCLQERMGDRRVNRCFHLQYPIQKREVYDPVAVRMHQSLR